MNVWDYPPDLSASQPLSEEERTRSRVDFFGGACPQEETWLFAYGSLIWRPDFTPLERRMARIHGYHRGLYLWSRVSRGTPRQPGLVLALDRGGSCRGMAFRLNPAGLEQTLAALWRREMPMESYRPVWLDCRLGDGRRVRAFSFVIARGLPCYAGRLSDEALRRVMATASGKDGTSLDYLRQTVAALRDIGIPDRELEGRLRRASGRAAK